MFRKLKQTIYHPILWLNKFLADFWFIIAINLIVTSALLLHIGGDRIDIAMSWFTMAMDQVIISAGWVIYINNNKFMQDERARLKRIEKLLEHRCKNVHS